MKKLRSYEWFGEPGIDSMVHRSWMTPKSKR